MENMAIGTYTTIDTAEIVRNRIEERIQEKKAAVKGRLRRAIDFLFSCNTATPYGLAPEISAKLYP